MSLIRRLPPHPSRATAHPGVPADRVTARALSARDRVDAAAAAHTAWLAGRTLTARRASHVDPDLVLAGAEHQLATMPRSTPDETARRRADLLAAVTVQPQPVDIARYYERARGRRRRALAGAA